jgi:hypothetical protein
MYLRRMCIRGCAALALLAVLSIAPPLPAQNAAAAGGGNYRVEVVIFRAATPAGSEDLGAPAEGRGFNDKRENGGAPPSFVRALSDTELKLGDVAARLRSSGAWQLLAHAGWIQTATSWNRHVGLPLDQLGINVPGLSGALYLERGDYLHFGVYLELTPTAAGAPALKLSELRRVKINERNYFDHPGFGVIAVVSQSR